MGPGEVLACRVAIDGKHVHAVELKFERCGRGPHQGAHAAVANGGAFVRLASGFFEYDIGRFDLLSILIHNALISKLAFFY